jgi:hypothetical protein
MTHQIIPKITIGHVISIAVFFLNRTQKTLFRPFQLGLFLLIEKYPVVIIEKYPV